MTRGIIAAMEEFNDGSGAEYNEGEYYVPDMETYDSIDQDSDAVIDSIDTIATHTDITDIIATEGVGNRPQIAAIALSALETRLFGQPVVGSRIGTESRTTIAIEGKNIFIRVWEAIVKFIGKIFKWFNELFGKKKEKEIKDRATQTKKTVKAIDKKKILDTIDSLDPGKPLADSLIKTLKNTYLFGYDNTKSELIMPVKLIGEISVTDIKKGMQALASDNNAVSADKAFNASDDSVVDIYIQEAKDMLKANHDKAKADKSRIPNMSYYVFDDKKFTIEIVKVPNATDILNNEITFDVMRTICKDMINNLDKIVGVLDDLVDLLPSLKVVSDALKQLQSVASSYKNEVNNKLQNNNNISDGKKKELEKFLLKTMKNNLVNVRGAIRAIEDLDKFTMHYLGLIGKLSKI